MACRKWRKIHHLIEFPRRNTLTQKCGGLHPVRIFISYRRADALRPSRVLYDTLAQKFDKENVFRDIDSLRKGKDFRYGIEKFITQCDVSLVVIGVRWLDLKDSEGKRRLDNPKDFVRQEVELSLRHVPIVIPILVDGAAMPTDHQLPVEIAQLAYQNAFIYNDRRDRHRLVSEILRTANKQIQPKEIVNPLNSALMQIFDFTLEDLTLNQKGEMSPRQTQRMSLHTTWILRWLLGVIASGFLCSIVSIFVIIIRALTLQLTITQIEEALSIVPMVGIAICFISGIVLLKTNFLHGMFSPPKIKTSIGSFVLSGKSLYIQCIDGPNLYISYDKVRAVGRIPSLINGTFHVYYTWGSHNLAVLLSLEA